MTPPPASSPGLYTAQIADVTSCEETKGVGLISSLTDKVDMTDGHVT